MTPLHHRTPLARSSVLSQLHGADVWLKFESAQPTGSFKLRGMGRACQMAAARGAARLVSSSGGNAGYAVAWAGRALGLPVTVVVPGRTAARMRTLIEAEGAEVLVHGDVWDDAHARALEVAEETSGAVIHPFDHPDVWDGHASLIEEVADSVLQPEVVVTAVGGGGLLCGLLEGMHKVGWTSVPVVAVETHGARSYATALEAGQPVVLPEITSLALTLGAKRVCEHAVQWAQRHPVIPWQCDDQAAVRSCARFLDDHRVLVEPSCGAALSAVYEGAPAIAGKSTLVVICGGASVTLEQLSDWVAQVG